MLKTYSTQLPEIYVALITVRNCQCCTFISKEGDKVKTVGYERRIITGLTGALHNVSCPLPFARPTQLLHAKRRICASIGSERNKEQGIYNYS